MVGAFNLMEMKLTNAISRPDAAAFARGSVSVRRRAASAACAIFLPLLVLACSSGRRPAEGPPAEPPADPPAEPPAEPPAQPPLALPGIGSFTASTDSLVAGAAVVLQWQVADAESLALDPLSVPLFGCVIQLTPSQSTTYCLQARNAAGFATSCLHVDVAVPTSPPPDVPILVSRFLAGGGVLLHWEAVSQADGYSVERTNGFGGTTFAPLASVPGDRYWITDTTTQANAFYTWRVRATNGLGSSPGVTASSISAPPPPEGPVGPLITALDGTAVSPGGSLRFTASEPVVWVLPQGPGSGAITPDGVFSAPTQTGLEILAAVGNGTRLVAVSVE